MLSDRHEWLRLSIKWSLSGRKSGSKVFSDTSWWSLSAQLGSISMVICHQKMLIALCIQSIVFGARWLTIDCFRRWFDCIVGIFLRGLEQKYVTLSASIRSQNFGLHQFLVYPSTSGRCTFVWWLLSTLERKDFVLSSETSWVVIRYVCCAPLGLVC